MSTFTEVVNDLKKVFRSGRTKPYEWRVGQLRQVVKMMEENSNLIEEALYKDLHKHRSEAVLFEIEIIKNDCINTINNLSDWMKPDMVKKDLMVAMDTCYIQSEPYGVALIIGAWNYPFALTIQPLIGAICAGNCAIVKPSELAEHTANALAQLIPKYLDNECIKVINGGVQQTTALLKERFDIIMYTGNNVVAKIVMAAAAKHLTPVIMELGGKSPVYVDKNVELTTVARRLMWGKTANSGQTCVAPDYVMCSLEVQDKLIEEIKQVVNEFYGGNPATSDNYGRIINGRHYQRVKTLLKSGTVAVGGHVNEEEKLITPTVLRDVKTSDTVMQSEIFGPVLPIVPVENEDEAIDYINDGEKPLAMYVFSNDKTVVNKFINQTSSGGVTVNDTMMHAGVLTLPFGGVGHSGMGGYHGKFSFDSFSHKRSVLKRGLGMEFLNNIRYPPFSDKKLGWIKFLMGKKPKKSGIISYLPYVLLGTVIAVAFKTGGIEAMTNRFKSLLGQKG